MREGQRGAARRPGAAERRTGTQGQIFDATERLLQTVPVHELSVAQIIAEAQLSRATFYFYFSSKYAVIVGLLNQIMDEVFEVARPWIERPGGAPPQPALRQGVENAARLWTAHRPAMRAVSEHWHAVPEIRELWLAIVKRFRDAFAREIDRQRRQGLAPPGVPSRQLVASLLWTSERCFYVAGLGVEAELPDESAAVDVIYALWSGAIYGGRPVTSGAVQSRP